MTFEEMNEKIAKVKTHRKKLLISAREAKISIEQIIYDYYNSNTFEQVCKDKNIRLVK